jgi:hypothetical protein
MPENHSFFNLFLVRCNKNCERRKMQGHYITYLSQLDSDPHSPTCGQRLAFRRMIETPGPVLRFEEWDRDGKAWRDAPPLLSIFGRGKTPNHITVAEEWAEREIVRVGGTKEDLRAA